MYQGSPERCAFLLAKALALVVPHGVDEQHILRLTSRAQARGADDTLRDSGTGDAIPRCLQRFVMPSKEHVNRQLQSDMSPRASPQL